MINQRLCILKIYYIQANLSSYDELQQAKGFIVPAIILFLDKIKKNKPNS